MAPRLTAGYRRPWPSAPPVTEPVGAEVAEACRPGRAPATGVRRATLRPFEVTEDVLGLDDRQAGAVGLLAVPAPLLTVVETVPPPVAAPAAVSLGMSGFTMLVLRRETDLPLTISGMIVPVVVFTGFGIAVLVHRYTTFSLVESALGLGLVLFSLVFAKRMIAPEP